MPGTSSTELDLIETISTNNLCGFSSFVDLIDQIIADPQAFYGLQCRAADENPFIALFFAERDAAFRQYSDEKIAKAAAVKRAFARAMLELRHADHVDPFTLLIDRVCAAFIHANYVDPTAAQPELKDKLVKHIVDHYREILGALYSLFHRNVIQEVTTDPEIALNQQAAHIESYATDGVRFQKFIQAYDQSFWNDRKVEYCTQLIAPENAYAARAEDMLFIARMLGCISKVTIYNVCALGNSERSALAPVISETTLNPAGAVELILQNTGFHWQPVRITVPDSDPTMPALEPISDPVIANHSPSSATLRFTPGLDAHMSMLFGKDWRTQQTIVNKLDDNNSEIYRMQVQAAEFIARTKQMNDLLDANSSAEIIEQKLASFRL